MKLNHKKIENTKFALKKLLQSMEQKTDSFIDKLVELRPDEFSDKDEDSVPDPFTLVQLMNAELLHQFETFRKNLKVDKTTDKVVDFKKKGDTSH